MRIRLFMPIASGCPGDGSDLPHYLISRIFRCITVSALIAGVFLSPLHGQAPTASGPVFRTDVEMLSIGARVTDRNNSEIHGLTADQFTLSENGVRQEIAFFAAEEEPISLGVMLDVSSSMASSGKLDDSRAALTRIIGAIRPEDELLYLQFHRQIDKLVDFTNDAQRVVSAVGKAKATGDGTSLNDSIARALCYMRASHHHRRALLVVTDGADEHSHRSLQELIPLIQASETQVFLVGYFGTAERDVYQSSGKKVTLVTSQEIDNPLRAFRQLSDESGAEAFFPHSSATLQEAVDAVAHELRTQYTVAYYPKVRDGVFRRIDVRVARPGARVRTRCGFAAGTASGSTASEPAGGCELEKLKPYPYESKIESHSGCLVYRDNFQDSSSGWPVTDRYHYAAGTYQISTASQSQSDQPEAESTTGMRRGTIAATDGRNIGPAEGTVVANGPPFENVEASVTVELKPAGSDHLAAAGGLVFRMSTLGFYAVVVSSTSGRQVFYKLVKKYYAESATRNLTQWTALPLSEWTARSAVRITVQSRGGAIRIFLQGQKVSETEDDAFDRGLVGMVFYGKGHAVFRDLSAAESCGTTQR